MVAWLVFEEQRETKHAEKTRRPIVQLPPLSPQASLRKNSVPNTHRQWYVRHQRSPWCPRCRCFQYPRRLCQRVHLPRLQEGTRAKDHAGENRNGTPELWFCFKRAFRIYVSILPENSYWRVSVVGDWSVSVLACTTRLRAVLNIAATSPPCKTSEVYQYSERCQAS